MAAAVVIAFPARDEVEAFQLGELAADGRVVASDEIGDLRDGQRAACTQGDEERKEGAVEIDAGLAQQHLVAPGAVQQAD